MSLFLFMSSLCAAQPTVDRTLTAMGTVLHLRVEAESRALALAASQAVVQAVERTEQRLSSWRPSSELSALNASAVGAELAVSPELLTDLQLALRCQRETNGAFDLTLGGGEGAYFVADGVAQRRRDVQLDAGGFGKGVALNAAIDAARAAGASQVMVDLGGQVAVFGRPTVISVAHPRRRASAVTRVVLENSSIATSSQSERPDHLINPWTGQPAEAFGSVSVISANAALADCVSTAAFIMGPQDARRWAHGRDDLTLITLEPRWWGVRVRREGSL